MAVILWLIIATLILLFLLAIIAISMKKKENRKPDYYAFYIIGIVWVAAGIPLKNYALAVMGFVFMIIGIVNKDKWKANRQDWKSLTGNERKLRIYIILIMGILLLVGLVVFYLFWKGMIY